MFVACWSAAWGAEPVVPAAPPPGAGPPPPGAILRAADRMTLGVDHFVTSPDGERVLMYAADKAVVLGPQGDPVATLAIAGVSLADMSKSGRFALVHAGGVTVHSDAGREIGRLAAFGKVRDLALSPDGRFLALATSLSSSVYDAVDGRTLWSVDGEATGVAYDGAGKLYFERPTGVVQVDPMSGAKKGTGALPTTPGLLPESCATRADGSFCPSGRGGAGLLRADGSMWLLHDGLLDRWHPIPSEGVVPVGADGGSAISALGWIGADGVLVARVDGHLERRGVDGAVVADVVVPDCSPCDPLAIGGDERGFWAATRGGTWMTWDPTGAPTEKLPRHAELAALSRLPDGRWVSLGIDGKARIGASPGKGGATKPLAGARGVQVAGNAIVVWSDAAVRLFGADRKPLPTPDVGVGRKPVSVALSPDGGTVAVLDDGGALHAYRTQDGHAVFRVMADIAGTQLSWAPGSSVILAGGDPLRAFSAADGAEILRLRLAPDGATERLAASVDGSLLVAHTTDGGQVLRRVPWTTLAP